MRLDSKELRYGEDCMTVEEAIQILHPDATADIISQMREDGLSDEEILDKVNEACVLACEIMKKSIKENDANAN